MNDKTLTHADTLRLLATSELMTDRDYRQREAAQVYYRARLICELNELHNDLLDITHTATTAVGRRKC